MQSASLATNPRRLPTKTRCFFFLALSASFALPAALLPGSATNGFTTQPLSLADAVNLALTQNPDIRRAQKDLEASQGVVIQTRAIAVPKVRITGNYAAMEKGDVDRIVNTNFTFGSDETWQTQIRVVQSLYEG